MKITGYTFLFTCCIFFSAWGQRGKIIKPATTPVMDPNQDGYVSKTTAGFSSNGFSGYYVDEFEFPMFGLPISGSGEALGDNQVGPNCGSTDITVDSLGFGVYAVLDNADNFIFRFRVGANNSSVQSYSILIDTDGKMGTDDPNSTPNNPGFEIDITLIKNSNKGVYIFNIDGIQGCPTALRQYSYNSHFQISIADIITCSNLDYFYDFYVPFADLQTLFGITKNTEMRFVAVTNISATCAMAGKISDVGGVDDALYGGCNTCAFLALGNDQCPTSLNNLCGTCTGFQSGVTPKPTIFQPVKAGETTITGTSVPGADIFVDLFGSNNVLKQSVTTVASSAGCTACPWSVTFTNPLVSGDIVSAKAKSPVGCQSGGVSSDATVAIAVNNIPPVISGALSTLSYLENDPPLPIDGNLILSDQDDINLDLATISISSNFTSGEDVLTFAAAPGIAGSYNPLTGIIQFTGVAPLTTYRSLLRSISYSNTSENPSTLTRTVQMRVNDGLDNSNVYSRSINVIRVNDAPVANDDTGTTNEDVSLTIPNVTANDTDVDGTVDASTVDLDPLTTGKQITFVNLQGTWSVDVTGAVTFNPVLDFNGIATKTYTVNDNNGATSNAATITITVISVNDPPVANDDSGSTAKDTPVTLLNITQNDTDVDGTVDPTTVDLDPVAIGKQSALVTAEGSWSVNPSGDLTFAPTIGFFGNASINYIVRDNLSAPSNQAIILIIVSNTTPTGVPPVANNDSGTTDEDTPVTLPNITANDTDSDGTVDATTVDLDPLTAGQQTSFTNASGTWTVNGSGDVSYTPTLNFNGTATKTYTVKDNSGATSNVATITITVNPVNDPPVANDDSGTTNEDIPLTLGVTTNDTDIDGTVDSSSVDIDPITAGKQTVFTNAMGSWSVSPAGNVTLTPSPNINGVTSIQYTVDDNLGLTSNIATLTILINAVNDKPVLIDLSFTTAFNSPIGGNLFHVSDFDPDGTPLSVNTVPKGAPVNGTIGINPDGSFTYTPNATFSGIELVEVEFCDNGIPLPPACSSKFITITVRPPNRPPVIYVNGVPSGTLTDTTPEDTPLVFCFEAVDPDGDAVSIQSFTNISGGGTLEVYGNVPYCFLFTPSLDFSGDSVWEINVCDNGTPSLCGLLTATISVIPVNDPPVAVRDSIRVLRNVSSAGNVMTNDFDVENDMLTVTTTPVKNVMNGQLQLQQDGNFTYLSNITFRGIDSLVYQLCDSGIPAECSNGTLIILVEDLPLKVYEGISPNGDGINDYLRIDGLDYFINNEVVIFDRYNNIVFQMRGYNNEDKVWTGQSNKGPGPNLLPEETYFYSISLGDGSPPLKGFIVLKRN
ncbi:MAG: Ig-like domain-containing protein [Cytophagales bacterium]|nr:Ig-like domain-containing protein [Cytophagales bacterium]